MNETSATSKSPTTMKILEWIKRLPIDLGQGWYRHTTKAKLLAFSLVGKGLGKTALDFGCGDGFWSEKLKSREWQVVSADYYNTRYAGVRKVNAEELFPFADQSFDLVWVAEVLEHVHNVPGFLQELRRVTKPDGRLILTTPNSAFWLYKFLEVFGITPKQIQNPDHKSFFSIQDIRRLFPRAQLYGFFPYAILKFTIRRGVGPLSPSFVIVEKR